MENWRKRWERFMFTEDMIVGGDTVLNPKPETYGDFVNMLDDIEDFIEQELSKAREEGRKEVYEAIVFDKNIPHDVTTFVAAHLWKNMRDKAKEELSKLNKKK